jgi:hypothetical protein
MRRRRDAAAIERVLGENWLRNTGRDGGVRGRRPLAKQLQQTCVDRRRCIEDSHEMLGVIKASVTLIFGSDSKRVDAPADPPETVD